MRVLYLSAALALLDQITKLLVKGFVIPFLDIVHHGMYYGETIPLVGNFIRLTFVENPGMAFGIELQEEMRVLLALFSIIASIALVIYIYYQRTQPLGIRISLALILAGAVGNFIDRTFYGIIYGYAPLFYGKVVDFVDVDFFDFELLGRSYDRWPIFNVADSAVFLGVFLLLYFYRKHEQRHETKEQEEHDGLPESESSTEESGDHSGSTAAELSAAAAAQPDNGAPLKPEAPEINSKRDEPEENDGEDNKRETL